MGKLMEPFGMIKGYDINVIGKLKPKKIEMLDEIVKYDNNIIDEIANVIKDWSKKKLI